MEGKKTRYEARVNEEQAIGEYTHNLIDVILI